MSIKGTEDWALTNGKKAARQTDVILTEWHRPSGLAFNFRSVKSALLIQACYCEFCGIFRMILNHGFNPWSVIVVPQRLNHFFIIGIIQDLVRAVSSAYAMPGMIRGLCPEFFV